MKNLVVLAFAISSAAPCFGQSAPSPLRFPTLGFSIQPLEDAPGGPVYQVLTMALKATDGFSPTVNVQVQPFSGSIDDYVTMSERQFDAAGIEIIESKKIDAHTAVLEYAGVLFGKSSHFYAKAVTNGTVTYLATATALQTQWPALAARMRACIDSFRTE